MKGSEKQIKWAEDIASKINDMLNHYDHLEKAFELESFKALPEEKQEYFKSTYFQFKNYYRNIADSDDAKFIIENRFRQNALENAFNDEEAEERMKHFVVLNRMANKHCK